MGRDHLGDLRIVGYIVVNLQINVVYDWIYRALDSVLWCWAVVNRAYKPEVP